MSGINQQSLGLTAEDLQEAQRKLTNLHRLTRNADIARYEEKLGQVGEDGYLSPQEESELNELKKQLNLADDDISHTYGKLTRLKRLSAIKDGNLPVLAAEFFLKKWFFKTIIHRRREFSLAPSFFWSVLVRNKKVG